MLKSKQIAVKPSAPARAMNLDWEIDSMTRTRQSERLAWKLFVGSVVVVGVQAAALMMLVPLHRVVPMVIAVDKLTGEHTVVQTDEAASQNAMLDKHFVKTFVVARERYSYPIVQADYLTVRRLAGDAPWATYSKLFLGEDSLDKTLGANVEVLPRVLSVTISPDNLATVRYEVTRTDRRLVTPPVVSRHVATLRYSYGRRILKEAEAIENPLGFTVVGYQTDAELAEEGAAK